MGVSNSPYSSLTDNELAILSKNGDDRAFDELSIRYLGTIRFIAQNTQPRVMNKTILCRKACLGFFMRAERLTRQAEQALKAIWQRLLNADLFL